MPARMFPGPAGPSQSPSAGPPGGPPAAGPPAAPGASGPAKVAVLLPLSGANGELGKAMLEAAQLALFTTGNDRLTLVPRDTGGTPESAAHAARSALAEGAQLILGPLLAARGAAVGPVAREHQVNVIAFSTATPLSGGNAFLLGILLCLDVASDVIHAMSGWPIRIAALAP